ncbi:LysR family transcriptional regulator [Paenibacillus sp. JSM ZJ436]|uniref:LysR family transcriptional regulator n=1 Tax=Paenibacillus sp. JSM ZJ436 TaxID=3376190 RepID=UPI00379F7DA9
MRIEWIDAFLATVETASLTKASEQLNLTQPALSKQIRTLEGDVGAELFVRSTTGVTLTKAGEQLLPAAKTIRNEWNEVKKAIAMEQGLKGIAIGAWPSVATSYLPKKLAFTNRSDYSLRISHSYVELLSFLKEGKIDVALFDNTGIDHPFFSTFLFAEGFRLYVHKDHPIYGTRENVYFEDIKDEEFLMLLETCDARRLIEKEFENLGATLNISSEIEFGHSILGFIEARIGISILPDIFTERLSADLRAIPIENFDVKRKVSIMARDEKVGRKVLAMIR